MKNKGENAHFCVYSNHLNVRERNEKELHVKNKLCYFKGLAS